MRDRDEGYYGYLGDVKYETWASGGSVDAVDHERVRDMYESGASADEAAEYECRRQRRGGYGDV